MKIQKRLFLFLSIVSIIACSSTETYDILIKNGQLFDGSGNKSYQGDIGINADTIAAALGSSLSNHFHCEIVYCFEVDGVYSDFDTKTTFSELNRETYNEAVESGILSDGILPKLQNAFAALEQGVSKVVPVDLRELA